ncbi:MAG: XdhC/CoxI family protein [Acidobacteriota bacterium]
MSQFEELSRSLRAEKLVFRATRLDGDALGASLLIWPDGRTSGGLGDDALDRQALQHAREVDEASESGVVEGLFFEIFRPPPKLVIVGAVHVAIHLVEIAQRLGFRTVVVDARAAFATEERFPHADELHVRWPGEALAEMPLGASSYCVFLTHDPKLDEPAIEAALQANVAYVGALGSKRTHAKRVDSLRERGLSEARIARICAPIGLPLGGRRPEEIAVSIAAQLVQARYGKLDPEHLPLATAAEEAGA